MFAKYEMKISDLLISQPSDTEELNEIITIQQLQPPTSEIIDMVKNTATDPVDNFQDTYAGLYGNSQLVVAIKQDDELLAYAIAELVTNSASVEFSTYLVPKNLYNWANDNGKSALKVIKAMISLSQYPVLSDTSLSPAAKKFLKRKVETGELSGEVFNMKTGQVSPYDPDIWETDDNERILIMEHHGRNHLNPTLLMPSGTWNWSQLLTSNKHKRYLT